MLTVRSGRTVPRTLRTLRPSAGENGAISSEPPSVTCACPDGEPLPLMVRLVPPPADKRASTEACWLAIDAVPCNASAGSSAVSGRFTRTPLSE